MKTWKSTRVGQCAEVLNRSDKRKTSAIAFIQTFLGILDLIGIGVIGLLGAITITGVQSKPPSGNIEKVLRLIRLDGFGFQAQVVILAIIATIVLVGKTLVSAYLVRKTLFFLSRRSATITSDLIRKLFSSSILTIRTKTSQNLIYSLTSGVSSMTLGVLGFAVNMIADIALLFVLLAGLFVINPASASATFIFFVTLGFFLHRIMHVRAHEIGRLSSEISILSIEKIYEVLTAYREIQVKNRRDFYIKKIASQRHELADFAAEQAFMPHVSKYVMEVGILLGALLMSAAQFITADATTAISSLFIFLAAGMRIAPAVLRIQQGLVGIRISFGAAAPALELISLLNIPEPVRVLSHEIDPPKTDFQGEIRVSNLRYTFPDSSALTLNDISFVVESGMSLAVVGPSGAGKTTLIDNLLGVLLPDSGEILISGQRPPVAISTWPGAIAYVPQDVAIFNGTIRNNVAIGFENEDVQEDYIYEALRIAQLDEFVRSLPLGLDSPIGENGANLSGGQRQRLGIARALYTKPKLLVLDEATSSLDGEVEENITEALNKLKGSVTVVLIAHRLSTVRNSDLVIYLEDGKIRASGNFEEVRKQVPNFDRQAYLTGL
jgi:ABC-type multidrug transport system fused ATPase/permease subunit